MKLRHIVLFQLRSDVSETYFSELMGELEALARDSGGFLGFAAGRRTDLTGMNQGFTHALTVDFADRMAADRYLGGLDQDGLGRRVSDMTVGGLGGILVMTISLGADPLKI